VSRLIPFDQSALLRCDQSPGATRIFNVRALTGNPGRRLGPRHWLQLQQFRRLKNFQLPADRQKFETTIMQPDTPSMNSGDPATDSSAKVESPGFAGEQDLRVCVVDDDPSVLKAMSRLIVSGGWGVESFNDPLDFLNRAAEQHPQLAVLDILMPQMNGIEVQRRLKQISPQTRVIILTSKDDPVVRTETLQSGASAFFLKPVDDDDFLAAVEAAAGPPALASH
jgi:CheY-like chemotaxis protein